MAIDWNADAGEVLKQLFSHKPAASSTSTATVKEEGIGIALLWPVLLLLIGGLYLTLLYLPQQQEIELMQSKSAKIQQLRLKKIELMGLNKQSSEAAVLARTEVKQLNQMMFAHREVDQLYRQIQKLARDHQIEVRALKKLSVSPVTEHEGKERVQKSKRGKQKKEADPLFYRIKLMLRTQGEFLDYLQLREALLQFGKMIHVDREKIRALRLEDKSLTAQQRAERKGFVVVDMELTAYQRDPGEQ